MEKTIENSSWLDIANQLNKVKSAKKKFAHKEKELEDRLKILSNNESFSSGRFAFVLEVRKGPVKYKDIPELKTIDLNKYRGPNFDLWRFKVLF